MSNVLDHLRGLPFPRGALALCYHGVVESRIDPRLERNLHLVSELRAHAKLMKAWNVVGIKEFLHEISGGTASKSRPVIITFDDGYENNRVAVELFASMGLPITIFVTTEAVSCSGLIWTVELSLLLLHGQVEKIELLDKGWNLKDRPSRELAFQAIRHSMKAMPRNQRVAQLEKLRAQFPAGESARLLGMFPSLRIMNWKELSALVAAGVDVGSHGVAHELHHSAQESSTRMSELTDSRRELQARLGVDCISFAFPNGDFNADSPEELRLAGYKLGFTTVSSGIPEGANVWLLPRISPGGSIATFRGQLKAASAE